MNNSKTTKTTTTDMRAFDKPTKYIYFRNHSSETLKDAIYSKQNLVQGFF